ncbi:MAG: GTPase Era [Acidimicrobiia bacterium]|nr:GTPase Era [Acidimicrobiia bacterium]
MRSGFVAVVGRPNVGKSTLVNALVGSKVSITSTKPQTTRNTIRGIMTQYEDGVPASQAVLVDTPGLHKPKTTLGERLNAMVQGTLNEADCVVVVFDATGPVGPGDRRVAERAKASGSPVICVVNKVDRGNPAEVAERLIEATAWDFDVYVPTSALTGEAVETVRHAIVERLTEGPMFFPSDATTDQPEHLVVGEIIREKFLDRLHDELPHSLVVRVREMEERANGTLYIDAQAIVERDSQKGIIIGKGGELLKTAGVEARVELEALFGTSVFLDLRVRVEKDWQQRPNILDRLGFE